MSRRARARRRRDTAVLSPWRRRLLLCGWLFAAVAIVARAGQLQVLQAEEWREIAEGQHLSSHDIPATRGAILDRNGVPLVLSRERFEISVDSEQVRDQQKDSLLNVLRDDLGASARALRDIETGRRKWVVLGTRFGTTERELVRRFHGVHVRRDLRRHSPYGDLALGVLGRQVDGRWRGGIEQAFSGHLAGKPGLEQSAKDKFGRAIPGQTVTVREPEAGGSVMLTIDVDLQEIAEDVLAEAIAEHGARGGDILVTDPHTGEILALASIQGGNTNALSAINTPYEPGSTIKPFTMAAVLHHGVASLEDSVDTGQGWATIRGRGLKDTHGSGVISFAEALRESSNIGLATAALRLTPRQHYEILRDFGFGTRTAVPLPGEESGLLEAPSHWEKASPVALAIGYEISVTPLQMAMAYGALANGGHLMEPRIVRELRDPAGEVERILPRSVRRVVSTELTRALGEVLVDVVEQGTGTRARMQTYRVAGKSGTALIAEDGGYSRDYFASFVGYFPADDPQIVVYAKLDAPQGEYFGGAVAAPLTRATMEAALASRQSPLSRSKLLRAGIDAVSPAGAGAGAGRILDARFVALPGETPPSSRVTEVRDEAIPVPDVAGLTPRAAVRRLHRAGFRVTSASAGEVLGTHPRAGVLRPPGDTIRIRARGGT
ncbi:MAG: PASTA domain-containing protein [Gemmatimonadetes bacterium]|nr:PASTA domain-containing protein [Gemmatimonadota bacterium]